MELILDGNNIIDKVTLYTSLKSQIKISEFRGNNLDALHDILTSIEEPILVVVKNKNKLENHLGNYLEKLLTFFEQLSSQDILVKIEH